MSHGLESSRLAVLVPRPRINLVLYHGVLGPRAAWRAEIVRRETSAGEREAAVARKLKIVVALERMKNAA